MLEIARADAAGFPAFGLPASGKRRPTVHTRVQFVAYQHVVKEEFNLVHTMEVGLLFAQQLRPT